MTLVTLGMAGKRQRYGIAVRGLLEGNLERYAQILAGSGTIGA